MSETEKPWEKAWTAQEMIENASNWNLAGDAKLLKRLEDFSEILVAKIKKTNDCLNELVEDTCKTNLALQNATNEFLGLRNTQFIENRVYDDDETIPLIKESTDDEKTKPTETEQLEEMKKAVCNGLDVLHKYYEKVELPESDSDDDNDDLNTCYRPIDPYADRPLPYLIGSENWHKYFHVGLAHSSSESEVEDEKVQFSDSDSDDEIQKVSVAYKSQITGISDSESEDMSKKKMSRPVANSTFNDNTNRNLFDSSSESETNSIPPQATISHKNFADELAAKLGKVESSNSQPEVNTRPIRKQPSTLPGGLFSDEPPPLDEDNDFFTKKITNSGLFSDGGNLFDDVNSDFWSNKEKSNPVIAENKSKNILFEEGNDETDDIFASGIANKKTTKPAKVIGGLFDDDEDEDDLFNTVPVVQPRKTILAPYKTSAPLVTEEPPELEPTTTKKKLAGAVPILKSNTFINQQILKTRRQSSSESEKDVESSKIIESTKISEEPKITEKIKEPEPIAAKLVKSSSLFDDASPLFSDDIFSTTSKFSSGLFDEPEETKTDKTPKNEKNKDKDESNKIEEPSSVIQANNKEGSIFDDDGNDLFSITPKKHTLNISVVSGSKSTDGLFDDVEDDLFSSKKTIDLDKSKKPQVNLFDPNPPELDESDNKSESQSQYSLDNEANSYGSINRGRALYDTDPQILNNESSGIVRDQSTRLESEDSSFYPYVTSSRHLSDVFHETQGDSLFTTKGKSIAGESIYAKPDLNKISEDESITKIDITPSGRESALYDDDSSVFINTPSPGSIIVSKTEQPKDNSNLFIEPETTKRKNVLFEDSDSEDDLFSNKSFKTKNFNLNKPEDKVENKNIFEDDLFSTSVQKNSDTNIFNEKRIENSSSDEFNNTKVSDNGNESIHTDDKKFNYEENLKSDENLKTDPKKSLSFEKTIQSHEETDGQIISTETSPGKLKHNLNINVAALLPGSIPPKRNLEKSSSFDAVKNENISKTEESELSLEKSTSFDHTVQSTEILTSASKERVRIPVKRRPSTRRARHEAIRKSAIDVNFEEGIPEMDKNIGDHSPERITTQNIINIAKDLEESSLDEHKKKNSLSNPLSPSTDEEDLLSMPREKELSSDNFTDSLFGKTPVMSPDETAESLKDQIKKSSETSKKEDLFDIFKVPDLNEDIFSSNKKEINRSKNEASIFSSSDSENDLFSTSKAETKKANLKLPDTSTMFPDEDIFKSETSAASNSKLLSKVPNEKDNLFDDEDIFSSIKIIPKPIATKKSLFDDDDDNDDIFGGSNTSSTNITKPQNSVPKKIQTSSRLKKLTSDIVQNIDDPLDALKK